MTRAHWLRNVESSKSTPVIGCPVRRTYFFQSPPKTKLEVSIRWRICRHWNLLLDSDNMQKIIIENLLKHDHNEDVGGSLYVTIMRPTTLQNGQFQVPRLLCPFVYYSRLRSMIPWRISFRSNGSTLYS